MKADEAAHEPGAEATQTTAQTCTICSYEIAPALGGETTEPTTAPTTKPTGATEITTPDKQGPPAENNFSWWIILVTIIIVGGGIAAFVIIKKKKN